MTKKDGISGASPTLPVMETLDLLVDGGTTDVVVPAAGDYTFIARVIITLRFDTSTLTWTEFGDETALTDGFYMTYNGVNLGLTASVKNNGDLFRFGYDVNIAEDQVAVANRVVSARWSFNKWMPHGLGMFYGDDAFAFVVQDDMTALTTVDELSATIQGWKAHP